MEFTLGLNYLNKTSIDIINGIPLSNIWILTSDGMFSSYSKYVWFDIFPGIWRDEFIWTESL